MSDKMSDKIRVKIVEDSGIFRGFWGRLVGEEADIEVVTTAMNGRQAVEALASHDVDVVLLDVEMPEMDGITAIPLLLAQKPGLKIIMASSHTLSGSRTTIDAMMKGAHDFIAKPMNIGVPENRESAKVEVLGKIRALATKSTPEPEVRSRPVAASSAVPVASSGRGMRGARVVLIGSSTGGPNALGEVLKGLPSDFDTPILIVQHMPAVFTAMLAERLGAESGRVCREAVENDELLRKTIYVAPGGFHMVLKKTENGEIRIGLNQEPPENFCRPAVDVLFRSVASTIGPASVAVVLTGMGEDGKLGCAALKESGARVLVQDEATSVVWGMPGAVSRAGLADEVLPLEKIADRIMSHAVLLRPEGDAA